MNTVNIMGRLVKDPIIEVTVKDTFYVLFNIASRDGKEKTNFIPCIAFDKTAEIIGNYCHKGNRICVQGSLQSSFVNDKFSLLVRVNKVELCETKAVASSSAETTSIPDSEIPEGFNVDEMAIDEDLPF